MSECEHNGFKYTVWYNGAFYEAVDRRGRRKIQRAPGIWCNVIECNDEQGRARTHQERVQDQDLIDTLDAAARTEQSALTPKGPRPVILTPGLNIGHPVTRRAHHRTPREKRANGRAE